VFVWLFKKKSVTMHGNVNVKNLIGNSITLQFYSIDAGWPTPIVCHLMCQERPQNFGLVLLHVGRIKLTGN